MLFIRSAVLRRQSRNVSDTTCFLNADAFFHRIDQLFFINSGNIFVADVLAWVLIVA
jgi:hypothetical protein